MLFWICVTNLELWSTGKSHLDPSRTATYLGMTLESLSLKAFSSQERVLTLQSQLAKFLSFRQQSVVAWRSLLGRLSSVCWSQGVVLYAVPSARTSPPVGFRGQVRRDLLDSLKRVESLVVVGPQPPSSGHFPGGPASRPTLVSRLGSRGGAPISRIVLFRVVGR